MDAKKAIEGIARIDQVLSQIPLVRQAHVELQGTTTELLQHFQAELNRLEIVTEKAGPDQRGS
jgi:hypothetical protein